MQSLRKMLLLVDRDLVPRGDPLQIWLILSDVLLTLQSKSFYCLPVVCIFLK